VPPPTVNQILQSRGIQHAHFIERLKAGEVQRVLALLNRDLYPRLEAHLQARIDRLLRLELPSDETLKRLSEMLDASREMTHEAFSRAGAEAVNRLGDFAVAEAEWQVAAVQAAVPFKIDFASPNPRTLQALAGGSEFEGRLLNQWFVGLGNQTQLDVSQALREGIGLGETTDQIVRRIAGGDDFEGAFGASRRNVEAVVRTATQNVSQEARDMTYRENDDIVKGWQFVATLDTRTTEICMAQDGEVYDVGDDAWRPPLHWNCRSTSVPILKSWKELGIPGLDELPDGTRSSMNGEVPEKTTYEEWLRGQSKEVQDEALGNTKAELWRRGEVDIDRFTSDSGRTLTLDELREREGISDKAMERAAKAARDE
jgi:SPP1 gp7 family putative phage head morphogenesis protein